MRPLLRTRFDHLALPLSLLGLAAIAAHNWQLWQQDKAFLAQKAVPPPLPPLREWPALPTVSVLVAAWNEAEHIERHIASFLALRYPHKELVLCAGGEDGTYDIACRCADARVQVLQQQSGEGKQRALARSFPQTTGEVIFLTDADCLLADEAFERTLWPLVAEDEQAASGTSQPLKGQMRHPFVFTQAATQIYSAMHSPRYAPGLLGRNAAVRRNLLEKTAALQAPAPTGTDYVLAKELVRAGARIWQAPESRLRTDYPAAAGAYLRQQRRWLRNVALHGRRFGAMDEMRASLRTSLVGLAMLLLPFFGLLLTPWLLVAWGVLMFQALCARLRYLGFAGVVMRRPVRAADITWQGLLLLLDFVAWILPLADFVLVRKRWVW